jgi:hypothetical protein
MMAAENQSGLTQVFEHRWLTDAWLIEQLAVQLKDIAARNDLAVQTWIEDELGSLIGCGGRLPSGVVIQLVESPHLVSHSRVGGPALYADAIDVDRFGIENLIAQALTALSLTFSDVEWQNHAPSVDEVESLKRQAEAMRTRAAAAAEASPKK